MASDTNKRPSQARAASERPLLRSFPNPSYYGTHLRVSKKRDIPVTTVAKNHLNAEITTRWADLVLIVCFFICGLIDAGAYNAYECFTAMQTGNTIYAALGVSDLPLSQPRLAWTKSVCAIVCYLMGAAAAGSFHRTFGERKRWVLTVSFAFQALLILIAAILVGRGKSSGSPAAAQHLMMLPADPGFPWRDLIPIGLLSFQAAGKVIASRVLQFPGLPCVVLTIIYGDMSSDPNVLTAGLSAHPVRNRKLGGVAFYFLGAVAGGAVARNEMLGFSGGLGIAAAVQFCLAGGWMFWKEDVGEGDDQEG